MSPSFVNTLDHPVRVSNGQGASPRIRPGQVVEADGVYADNLSATAGVENATKKQSEAYAKSEEDRRDELAGGAARLGEKLALSRARSGLRRAVAATNRRVVGDDAAPLGPPSGEISSKAQEAVKSDAQRAAFAPGERLPGERVQGVGTPPELLPRSSDPSSGEVENAQARDAEVAEEVLADLAEAGQDVIDSKPWQSTPADADDEGHPANESVEGDEGDGDK